MSQVKLQPNVLSLGAARASKAEAEPRPVAKANGYGPGAIEPPLPLTPERLELIKALARPPLRRAPAPTASQIAQRFAPQGQAGPPQRQPRMSPQTPLAPPLLALASGIRTLAAVLILVAVVPNLVLGAIFWLGLLDPLRPQPETPAPQEIAAPAAPPQIALPVLSAPATLEATEAETVLFPLALAGTDGVPPGSVIVVKGVPQGGILSSGYLSGETDWILELDEIGDLRLALPDAGPGEAKLTVQLLAPNGGMLADTATTLRIAAAEKTGLAETAEAEPAEDGVPEQGSEAAAIEDGQASPDAAPPMAEAVPLPDRRPDPNAGDDGQAGWVRPSAYVNLRQSPSSSAPVAGIVAKGAKLRVMGRKRGWVQVTNPATSQSGWIYAGNVETAP